ncbi:N-acetyltransferase family protein [Haloferacaceae archaeon DSL9]
MPAGVTVRRARLDDEDAVASFTRDTWSDREGAGDYIPRVFADWVAGDGDGQRTFVAEVDGEVAGIVQGVLLSPYEAWGQGIRVDPRYRDRGVSRALTDVVFDWARERGATVLRVMVFSWNVAGLGQTRATGYEPCTEFRWAEPMPDANATPSLAIESDPDAAWAFWNRCEARTHLRGLVLDADESWALSSLTRERLHDAAADDRLFVVQEGGTRGFACRNRTYDRPSDDGDEVETWAEYAVAAWADAAAASALLRAIAADAASVGADRARVLVPESARWVSDVTAARVAVSDEPDFVMAADLTNPAVGGSFSENEAN